MLHSCHGTAHGKPYVDRFTNSLLEIEFQHLVSVIFFVQYMILTVKLKCAMVIIAMITNNFSIKNLLTY